ncbi:MAG: hypothetical protein LBS24_00415 [Clostridiales Family XIII bacterium]|jgi:hypothetical protein|nr:hypothetical protein [Clostridiales Family XIII bacterium]
MAEKPVLNALGHEAAYRLADVTKTKPQFAAISPMWAANFLRLKGLKRVYIV